MNTATTITIAQTVITQDDAGRYCLNDLHRAAIAAGINARAKEPAEFLRRRQTTELIEEIETTGNSRSSGEPQTTGNLRITAVHTVEGRQGGTYVAKELMYAYAMWVSPKFHLHVIRAYDAMVQQAWERVNGLHQRALRAELEFLQGMEHASRCGLGLRQWRADKPSLAARLEALQREIQPMLPMFH